MARTFLKKGDVPLNITLCGPWHRYCRINANSFAKIHPEAVSAGGQAAVITPEIGKYNRHLKDEVHAACPILSDLDCGYAFEF